MLLLLLLLLRLIELLLLFMVLMSVFLKAMSEGDIPIECLCGEKEPAERGRFSVVRTKQYKTNVQ